MYGPTLGYYSTSPYSADSFGSASPYGPGMPSPYQSPYAYSQGPPTSGGELPPGDSSWWGDALDWLWGQVRPGDGDEVAPKREYFEGALAGTVWCPGPFTVEQVYRLLSQATPSQVNAARSSLSATGRGWIDEYPPANLRQLAGALVNEAHGGRKCTPSSSGHRQIAQAIYALASEVSPGGGGGGGGGFPTNGGSVPVAAGTGTVLTWLALAGLGAKAAGLW